MYRDSAYLDYETETKIVNNVLRFHSAKKQRKDYLLTALTSAQAKGYDQVLVDELSIWHGNFVKVIKNLKQRHATEVLAAVSGNMSSDGSNPRLSME